MERIREWIESRQAKNMSLAALCAVVLTFVFVFAAGILTKPGENETRFVYSAAASAAPEAGLSIRAELSSDDAPARAIFLPVTGARECDRAIEAAVRLPAEQFDRQAVGDGAKDAELNIHFELYRFSEALLFVKFESASSFADRPGYHTVACDLERGRTLSLAELFRTGGAWREKVAEMAAEGLAGQGEATQEMCDAAAAFDETTFYVDGEMLFVFIPGWDNGTWAQIQLKRLYGLTKLGFPGTEEAPPPATQTPPALPNSSDGTPLNEKTVYLSFADSLCGGQTAEILKILREQDAKATFFPVGICIPFEQDLFTEIIRDGHAVGGHTWSHTKLSSLSPAALAGQLSKARTAILSAGGENPTVFYPPYGVFDSPVRTLDGMEIIRVNLCPQTALYADETALTQYLTENIRPGCVLLLDERDENCTAATRCVLRVLDGLGYSFAALS